MDKKSVDGQLPVRLCNYTDVYYNDRINSAFGFMAATASGAQAAAFQLHKGDSLITKDSETADDIGVSAYVDEALPGVVCGYHLAIIRPLPHVEPRFLNWAIRSDFVREQWAVAASGVTRFGLTYGAIKDAHVPLPPLDVQRRIADFLDDQVAAIDAVTRLRKQQQRLLEERQRALLADLVSDSGGPEAPLRRFLRPRQEFDRADLPVLSVYRDHGVILKSSRNDNFNKTPEDISRYQRVAVDDLVVNKMKAWSGSVAVSSYEGIVSPDYLVCEVLAGLVPQYLHLVLRSPHLVAEMGVRSRGIRPNQERLYWDDLAAINVPVPDLVEQRRVIDLAGEALASVDGIRRVFSRVLGLLHERKRSLITTAVTGEFDVTSVSFRVGDVAFLGVGGAE